MTILIDNRDQSLILPDFLIDDFEKVLKIILNMEKIKEDVEVSVSFVTEEEIKKLNAEYREKDRVTDVLSFPTEMIFHVQGVPAILGDVVICSRRAKEQSKEYGHSFKRELMYLFVHSIFHLLGYDHIDDNDKLIMRQKEKQALKEIGIFRNEKQ